MSNLDSFYSKYQKNFNHYDLQNIMWGRRKNILLNKVLAEIYITEGFTLIISNELNSIFQDLNKYSSARGY